MSDDNKRTSRLDRLRARAATGTMYAGRYKYVSGGVVFLLLVLIVHAAIGWSRTVNFNQQEWLATADKYEAIIRRDAWGVPHVLGERDEDVAFGAAYAQATDALPDLEHSLRLHTGRMGLLHGRDGARSDWLLQLVRSQQIADERWLELPEKLRSVLEAYADGLNYFAAEHDDDVDASLYPVSGQDLMAATHFQQLMFYGLGDIVAALVQQDLDAATGLSPETDRGSNAIAISSSRGWGSTRLLINSHQPLTGPFSWYEMRLSSEEGWDIHGGTFPGSPFVFLGVGRNLGWGATVNRPGLTDLYQLEVHPSDPRRYRMDGVWWDMTVRTVELPVRLLGNFFWTLTRELEYSKHGPVFRVGDQAYALHYAGADEIRQNEQWYRMNRAQDRDQWWEAMQLRALPSLNFIYADARGNIDFLYNASLRKRPEALIDERFLPGTTTAAMNLPLHAFEDLPQLRNPDSGWIASTNQTPLKVTGGRDNPPAEQYARGWRIDREINNRSLRIEELLARAGPVDGQRLVEIKFDKSYSQRFRHLDWRPRITDGFEPNDRLLEDAQRELVLWDLSAGADNPHAAIGVCMVKASMDAEKEEQTFELIASMRRCAGTLEQNFGTLSVPMGEVLRLRRGEQSWPLGGGPDLLRAIHSQQEDDGTRTAVAGDGLILLAEWNDRGLRLNALHQFGSSRMPSSPHFADQSPLFSTEEFRPTFDFDAGPAEGDTLSLRIPY